MDHASDETKKVGEALAWIVGVLQRNGVPYQVVGGLAARAHGAERPIVDVDLYVPFDQAQSALEEIRPNFVWGPQHHAGDEWDLTFLKADHGGQRVELGDSSSDPRFFDREKGSWVSQRVDYDAGVRVGHARRGARAVQARTGSPGGSRRCRPDREAPERRRVAAPAFFHQLTDRAQTLWRSLSALPSMALFTRVRGRRILRTS